MENNLKFYSDLKEGVFSAPSFKSDTIRKLLVLAFLGKPAKIYGASLSLDEIITIKALDELGVKIEVDGYGIQIKKSANLNYIEDFIDCGESATLFRLLFPLLLFKFGEVRLTGQDSIFSRPLDDFKKIFPQIDFKLHPNTKKCEAKGVVENQVIEVNSKISSQYLSGVFLACALIGNGNKIKTDFDLTKPNFATLTLDVLKEFGFKLKKDEKNYLYFEQVKNFEVPTEIEVRRDYTHLLTLLALTKGIYNKVSFDGLSVNDKYSFEVFDQLNKIGYTPIIKGNFISLPKTPRKIDYAEIDLKNSIDNVFSIFALCLTNPAKYRFLNIDTLSFKESDRLSLLFSILKQLKIQHNYDGGVLEFSVSKNCDFYHVNCSDFIDHRAQILELIFKYWAKVPEFTLPYYFSVFKSYPEFLTYFKTETQDLEQLEKLRQKIDEIDKKIESALFERKKITDQVARFKKENSLDLVSHERRHFVINRKKSILSRNFFNRLVSFTESSNQLSVFGAGLVGQGIADSLSPDIHEEISKVVKVKKYRYELFECANEKDLPKLVENLILDENKLFLNITTPFKNSILKITDQQSDIVKETKAANTVFQKYGKLYLLNTDFFGVFSFIHAIPNLNDEIYILGNGAVARTIKSALEFYAGYTNLAKPLTFFVSLSLSKEGEISYSEFLKRVKGKKEAVIFNATTCSFQKLIDQGSFDPEFFETASFICSVNYKLDSLEFRLKYPHVMYGEKMLIYQAFVSLYAALTNETDTGELLSALFWYMVNAAEY